MSDAYIEQRDCVYLVKGTRVSLDSIVYAYVSGQSVEAITQAFPSLSLEQVYGAITSVSTDDISYVVSAQLQRVGARLSGTIMVGYYMRSASGPFACSSSGTLDVELSSDGKILSGTSVLSLQPHTVPRPFEVLCSALPYGTRSVRLTRQ